MNLMSCCLWVMLFTCSFSAFSQFKYIKPELGLSLSSKYYNWNGNSNHDYHTRPAEVLGASTAIRVSSAVNFKLGLFYTPDKVKEYFYFQNPAYYPNTPRVSVRQKANYAALQLWFSRNLGKKQQWFVDLGGFAAYLHSAKAHVDDPTGFYLRKVKIEISNFWHWGVVSGLGYRIPVTSVDNLTFQLRPSWWLDDFYTRVSVSLVAGYEFAFKRNNGPVDEGYKQ